MAKTNAEYVKTWKAKQKHKESYKQKRKLENKSYRDKIKATETASKILKRQKDARLRKQKSRAAQKAAKLAEVGLTTPKKMSPSAIGKAVKKALTKGLPKSPRSRRTVLVKISEMEGVNVVALQNRCRPTQSRICPETVKKVEDFYQRDDISRTDPGRKSAIVQRRRNGGAIQAKRYLLFTINEVFSLFQEENPEAKIGRSKFAELRPVYVKQLGKTPHNVCVCKIHDNFNCAFNAVSMVVPRFGTNVDEFINSNICDKNKFLCMKSECDICKRKLSIILEEDIEDELNDQVIKYHQWLQVGKRLENVIVERTVSQAMDDLKGQLTTYLLHTFVKKQSQAHFLTTKEQSSPECLVMQVDFAENYTAQYQDEIQSAHWGNPQVSVFTAVVWWGNNQCKSYAIVSDNITHDRVCVDVFIRKVLEDILKKFPGEKSLHVFSDGCAAQFRSRYNFSNMTFMKQDFKFKELTWTYFATAHGKGAVDGIGAVVKRHVWNMVRSNRGIVRDSESFANVCKDLKIHVVHVPSEEIRVAEEKLSHIWEGILPIKGTLKMHHFEAKSPYTIRWKEFPQQQTAFLANLQESQPVCKPTAQESSSDCEYPSSEHEEMCNGHTEVQQMPGKEDHSAMIPVLGMWVVAIYDENWLPGTVESIHGSEVRVKFMKVIGPNRFMWPIVDDFDTIPWSSILTTLHDDLELKTYSSRGAIYCLAAREFQRVLNLYISFI